MIVCVCVRTYNSDDLVVRYVEPLRHVPEVCDEVPDGSLVRQLFLQRLGQLAASLLGRLSPVQPQELCETAGCEGASQHVLTAPVQREEL